MPPPRKNLKPRRDTSRITNTDKMSLKLSEETPINGRMLAIKYNVHTVLQDKPKDKLKKISTKLSLPIHLMLLNLDGNMNIAMSIRTAAVLGCSDVWVVGRRKYDARPEVGSKNYVNVHKVGELTDPKAFFESKGLQPILLEQGGTSIEEFKFKPFFKKPICFIVGSESHGIPKEFMKAMGDTTPRITISQYGLVRSLNVSIAASIVMYEALKQWRLNRKEF